MLSDRNLWSIWAHVLQRGGIKDFVSFLLEGGGPLSALMAQVFYLGQPFFSQGRVAAHFQALAELLENREESRSFAAYLREENIL
jgi:hypothetical protein